MALGSMICPHCNRKMDFNAAEPPKFCLYCGKKLETQTAPEQTKAKGETAQDTYTKDGVEFMEIAPKEYEGAEGNNVFKDSKNVNILNGWLPDGYVTKAEVEANKDDMDCPLAMWARAKKADGTEMFCRRYKRIKIDKQKEPGKFLGYEQYLDKQAAAMLETDNIRLIMRVPADDGELEEMRQKLIKHKHDMEKLPMGVTRFVVQGEYGAIGGKLYEADVNGRKRYLFLHSYMLADEHGMYSEVINSMRRSTGGGFMGMGSMGGFGGMGGLGGVGGLFGQQAQPAEPVIDTDPNTPFGMHRTDGLISNTIYWNIVSFGGLLSDTRPQRSDITDYLRFSHSLSVHPDLQAMIQQFQQQMVSQKMMSQQMLANSMQQAARQRQQEMDRHNAYMSGIRRDMDNIQQQMINSSNEHFDRSVRQSHEMVMGVNTYERTDGTNFEADVRYDRVFQRDNDPSLLVGTSSDSVEAPIGWTELHRLD